MILFFCFLVVLQMPDIVSLLLLLLAYANKYFDGEMERNGRQLIKDYRNFWYGLKVRDTRRVLGNYSNYLFMTGSSKILFTRFFITNIKKKPTKTKNQGESLFLNRFLLSGKSQIIKLGDKSRKLLFVLLVFPSLMAPLLPLSFFNKKRSLLKK